jgi:archaemetzincin
MYLEKHMLMVRYRSSTFQGYGLKPDEFLFQQRIIKEAVYELGHAFGLRRCKNKMCVMRFSNSLADTDIKEEIFCKRCKTLL